MQLWDLKKNPVVLFNYTKKFIMKDQTIKLEFTVEEIDKITGGLSKLPYEQVFQLVGKIVSEAREQLADKAKEDSEVAE